MTQHDDRGDEVAPETSPTPQAPPDGLRATYLGHREVPESEQVWEIHLRPKQRPES